MTGRYIGATCLSHKNDWQVCGAGGPLGSAQSLQVKPTAARQQLTTAARLGRTLSLRHTDGLKLISAADMSCASELLQAGEHPQKP